MATNSKRNFYAVGFDLLLLAILAGLVVVALCAGKYPISAKESIDVLFGELFNVDNYISLFGGGWLVWHGAFPSAEWWLCISGEVH